MAFPLASQKEFTRQPYHAAPALAHQVPIATVRDDLYVLTDGSMAAVYRVRGAEYDLASDHELALWAERLRAVINSMPTGVQMKIVHRISHNVRATFEAHDRELTGKQYFARWVAWDRARRLHRAMARGELLANENLVVLTYNPAIRWWESDRKLIALRDFLVERLLGNKETVLQRSARNYELARIKFEEAIASIVNQMRLADLRPLRMTDQALYEHAWEVLNPGEAQRRGCPGIQRPHDQDPYSGLFAVGPLRKVAAKAPDITVVAPVTEREQLVASDWIVGDRWVRIGDTYYGAVVLRALPTHHYPGLALKLTAIPFECTIAIDLQMLQKQDVLERQWARVRSAQSKARTTLFGAAVDPARVEAAADQERAYMALASGSENPLRFRLVITVAGRSPTEVRARTDKIIAVLRSLESAQGLRAAYDVPECIKATWAFGLVNDLYTRRLITSQAANLMPLYNRWEGSERAVTLCLDPMGRLVKHDPFPGNLLSRNKTVTGMTGSGKSFMVQQLDVHPSAAKPNTEILIVESGGSFEMTTRCFGGRYLRLGAKSDYQINPFDLPSGFDELSDGERESQLRYKYGFITNLVLAMVRLSDPEAQQIAANVVGTVTRRTYERHRRPLFRDFYHVLGEYTNAKDTSAEELAGRLRTLLANYVVAESGEEGIYAKFFDRETNVDVEGCPLLDFDLIDVKGDKQLLTPFSLVVIGNLIYNRLMRRDGKERLVVIDEAWALIKEDEGEMSPSGQLIELFFREARKLGGSCIFITQNYSDMTGDKIGRAVVGNALIQYFGKHERSGVNDAAFRSANFSKAKADKVYGLNTLLGQFSEWMIKEGDAWGIVRVPAIGPGVWLATSHHTEVAQRDRYFHTYQHGYGLADHEVIVLLAEDYPGGCHAPTPHPELTLQEGLQYIERWREHYARFCQLVDAGEPIPYNLN